MSDTTASAPATTDDAPDELDLVTADRSVDATDAEKEKSEDRAGAAFYTCAAGMAAGMTGHQLRNPRRATGVWGVRCDDDSMDRRRERAALALAPKGALSHLSAAVIHGLPLPPGLAEASPVSVMVPANSRRIRRKAVRSRRGLERRRTVGADNLPVTVLSDTWADLAGVLDEADLIAVGDAIVSRGGEDAMQALQAVVAERSARHARNTVLMQKALPRIRSGSASRMESLCRVAFEDHGLPEPELNAEVRDAHGEWLATVDFLWRHERVIVEYQSAAHHEAHGQRVADEERRRQLEALGYRVIFVTAAMIFNAAKRNALLNDLAGLLLHP